MASSMKVVLATLQILEVEIAACLLRLSSRRPAFD